MRPRRAPRLDAADEIELALKREDLYDRRWTRHRDQLLTAVGVAGPVAALVLGVPALSAAAVLPTGPRAVRWALGLMANRARGVRPDARERP